MLMIPIKERIRLLRTECGALARAYQKTQELLHTSFSDQPRVLHIFFCLAWGGQRSACSTFALRVRPFHQKRCVRRFLASRSSVFPGSASRYIMKMPAPVVRCAVDTAISGKCLFQKEPFLARRFRPGRTGNASPTVSCSPFRRRFLQAGGFTWI